MSVAETWGSTEEERARAYPCDGFAPADHRAAYRAIDVAAPPAIVFRWLCQLRVAPYSYDWIDNWGRRSPEELTPGAERLEVGQDVMTIFELLAFEPDGHITIRMVPGELGHRVFGDIWVSYVVEGRAEGGSRLLVKLCTPRRPGILAALGHRLAIWGDLVMMRRQLLNLARLAAGSARD